MNEFAPLDESLLRRLPLPLAQVAHRAHNAQTALDRHLTAFYLWEAALKLLSMAAIVAYARQGAPDAALTERLKNLARPALGHWWEFARLLVPWLAERGQEPYRRMRELLLGRSRDDLPRAAGLDAVLREGKASAQSSVRLTELFDRLVEHRNKRIGHGVVNPPPDAMDRRLGAALLAGVTEILDRLDVLAGKRLLYFGDVRQSGGVWLVERFELTGETPRRIASLEVPRDDLARLPDGERLYLAPPDAEGLDRLTPLHPLLVYDAEAAGVLFLNARRGRQRAEYLNYTNGRTAVRADWDSVRVALLAQVLGTEVRPEDADGWAVKSQADEGPVEEAPSPTPRLLGDFELLSELGRGGMGVVYRAWQPSLGRQVAMKKLLRSGDTRAEARFRREIHALGQVEHPNLVKVFTSGSDGDNWFYAMELIEGADLATVCAQLAKSTASEVSEEDWTQAVSAARGQQRQQEKPLSQERPSSAPSSAEATSVSATPRPTGKAHIAQVVELVRQAAEAAHALHEAGVIHRDIKPANILLSAEDGRAVLMDLGLAQLIDESEGRLTRTRQFVGTLRYASPEQIMSVKLDARTDVYSLGATLWELLTLRPLFGVTEQTPTPELMLMIQTTDAESVRKYNPRVPRDLEAVVMKCLEKDRLHRYATAQALAADLERWQREEPVLARRQTLVYRLGKRLRKHRRKIVAGMIAGCLLLATWFTLADNDYPVPGSLSVQQSLDRHEASIFRPAPSEKQLRIAAADQRRVLRQHLLDMVVARDGWFARPNESTDSWTQMQGTVALFSSPEADREHYGKCVDLLDHGFEPNNMAGPFIPGYGWASVDDGNVSAESTAWAVLAIVKALTLPGLLPPAKRERLLERLDQVQTALDNYRSQDKDSGQCNGGWNLFAHQDDPDDSNVYITLLVCQGLFDLHQADLPWHKSRELRDSLLKETIEWLLQRFDGHGWSTPSTVAKQFNDGLTLQIFTTLLLAEAAGQVKLSSPVLDQISRLLAECSTRALDYKSPLAIFYSSFHNHLGKHMPHAQRVMRPVWYAWAVNCATCWLRRCERTGAPHDEIVRTRRVLGHLLITLGPTAIEEANKGYVYVSAEMLIGLASIDQP